jgi:hypothetical protein
MPSVVRSRLAPVRRALGLVVIMGLLACAVAFYRVAPGLPASPKPARTSATPTAPGTSSRSASPSDTSTPTASPTPIPRRSTIPPDSRLPDGPGTTTAGIYLIASPASDGSFDVNEFVLLDTPVSTLDLRLPPVSQGGSEFRSLRPSATQVQASADSQPVVIPDARIRGDISLPLVMPATRFELRYRLKGVTLRTMRSVPGRAIAVLAPVSANVPPNLPVRIQTRGEAVLNLSCPSMRLSERACAAGSKSKLRVNRNLPWRQALVLVQLNLPRPQ